MVRPLDRRGLKLQDRRCKRCNLRTALKILKKIMSSKKDPFEMERLLVELCDADGDFSERSQIEGLIAYVNN